MIGEFALWLEPGSIGRTEVSVEQLGNAEVGADPAGGGAVFVGEHGGLTSGLLQGREELAGPRQELDVVEHRGVPIRAVNGERGREVFPSGQAGDGEFDAAADGRAHLRESRGGQAQFRHGVGVAAMDGGEVIDERAIEIKEDGAVAHEGR